MDTSQEQGTKGTFVYIPNVYFSYENTNMFSIVRLVHVNYTIFSAWVLAVQAVDVPPKPIIPLVIMLNSKN
jgi:hypothetical protein